MKRVIAFFIILISCTALFATGMGNPNLHLTNDTVYMNGNTNQSTIQNLNHLRNTGSTAIEIKWEVIENDAPSVWGLGFCDKESCYALDGNSHTYILPAGDSSIMDLLINPNNVEGTARIRIAVYPSNGTPADGYVITHLINITKPSGINSAPNINFTMFPNPVKDNLNINFSRKGNHHIEIYNILGNKILVKDVVNTDYVRIPFSGYLRGRYIVMYRSENGKVITKSITKE